MRFLRKILVFLAFLILYTGNIAASENVPQRFLIIHSYSSGCKWTDHIHGGILDELRNQDPTIRFNVEYMDSQYLYDHEFEQNLYSLYRKKYEDTHFDGIIVSDNNAVNFILVYGEELFKDVPVVACGVNHLTWRLADSHIDSFILEQPDMVRSVEDMKSIFPEMETLNFIFSSRNRLLNTNSDVLNEMRDVNRMVDVRVFDNGLNNRIIEELSMTDGTNNVIFLSPYSAPQNRETFHSNSFERRMSTLCDMPIFVSLDYQMGSGAFGGRMIDSEQIGRQSVKTMLQILNGEEPLRYISKYDGMYKSLYDYNVMKRFGIRKSQLPDDAELINEPPSFFYLHRYVIPGIILLMIYLVNILRSRSKNLKKQKIINNQKEEIIELREEFIQTQMELIETLGELIEKRSKETSSHVRRVAMISGFLARKSGMDKCKVKLLEAASPMHDIGKIGVPDHILQKREALTDDEFETIKRHTVLGYEVLNCSQQPLFEIARIIAYSHHENWDGTGYPLGLKGIELPLEARITRIADVFDALLSERPYKKAWPFDEVMVYMKKGWGSLFDPDLLDLFVDNINEIIEIFWSLEEPEYYDNLVCPMTRTSILQ